MWRIITKFKIFLISFVNLVYKKIFGQEISKDGLDFINNITISAIGSISAAFFMFIATILAGRWLGPIEYGKFALVLSYAQFLIIPISMGLDTASVVYISSGDQRTKKKILATSFIVVFCNSLIISIIFLLTLNFWVKILNTDQSLMIMALIYAVPLAFKNLFDSFIRGFQYFKKQLWAKVGEALIALLLFTTIFWTTSYHGYFSYTIAMVAGLLIYSFILMPNFIRYLKGFDKNIFRKLLSYGSFALIGGLSGFLLFNADRIIIARILGEGQLGIYAAYYTASISVLSQFFIFFINVFFPAISKISNKYQIIKKINRLNYISAIPLIIFECLAIALILYLYGSQYSFQFGLAILFSLMAVSNIFYTIDAWIASSAGVKGVRKSVKITFTGGILHIILSILLIYPMALHGVIISSIMTHIFLLVAFKKTNKRLFFNHQ